ARIICAMPRASLRSVLLICALSTACMCRVSNTDHRQACFGEGAVKPLRQRPSFQSNSLEAIERVRQNLQESFRLTRNPRFPHDPARIIHNADARLLDRYVESSKIVHAALLLLMLEAAYADLVSPSA